MSNTDNQQAAISLVKSYGYSIRNLDINKSGVTWEVDSDSEMTLVQPLSSIKGLGDVAIDEIIKNRPFTSIENLLFNDNVKYNKLNKRGLDALCRSGALSTLMDSRFSGAKHFWSAVAVDRPKSLKKFNENIELYRPEGEFNDEERIENLTALTGVYPISLVVPQNMLQKLNDKGIYPLAQEGEAGNSPFVWFIPRKKSVKTTKNGKPYWILEVIDGTNTTSEVKCWGIRESDVMHINRLYMAQVSKDSYGYSIRNFKDHVRLLG